MKKELPAILLAGGAALFVAGGVAGAILFAGLFGMQQSRAAVRAFSAQRPAVCFENQTADEKPDVSDAADKGGALYSIVAPEGFSLKSYSKYWDEAQLQLLYEELKQNKHGPELETLNEICVYAQAADNIAAMHTSDVKAVAFMLNFGALPPDFAFDVTLDVSNIALYGGDKITTVAGMARSLSHEYGHLYTLYYMLDEDAALGGTEYAALREWRANGLITTTRAANYGDEHYRYLVEVAAEDYVQLMGSPATRTVTDFPDVRGVLAGAVYPELYALNTEAANLMPQENLMIPLATEVPGLADYFYSFLNEAPPAPAQGRQDISLQIQQGATGFDLTGGYRSFVYYTLTWNTPYEDAIYTVGCYDPDDYMVYPVKTVYTGQQAVATVGTATADDGAYVYWQSDGLDSGTKVFFVVAQLPDGTCYLSDRLEYTF